MQQYGLQAQLIPNFAFYRVRSNGVLAANDAEGRFKLRPCDASQLQPFLERAQALQDAA